MDRIGEATSQPGHVVSVKDTDRAEQRAKTVGPLLRSASTAAIWVVAGIMMIETLGFSIVPVIASAGILGLAIGFGAQSVVEDMLRWHLHARRGPVRQG